MERGISALIVDSATLSRLEGEPPKTPELRVESDSTETDDDSFVTTSYPWTGKCPSFSANHDAKIDLQKRGMARISTSSSVMVTRCHLRGLLSRQAMKTMR